MVFVFEDLRRKSNEDAVHTDKKMKGVLDANLELEGNPPRLDGLSLLQ